MQEVRYLAHQMLFVLVDVRIRHGDLPQSLDDLRFLLCGEFSIHQACELKELDGFGRFLLGELEQLPGAIAGDSQGGFDGAHYGLVLDLGDLEVGAGQSETFGFVRGNVLVLTVSGCLGMFCRGMVFPYIPLYILSLGGQPAEVGLVYALTPLGGLIAFPIAGYLADRMNRVRLIAFTGYFSSAVLLINVVAPSWEPRPARAGTG